MPPVHYSVHAFVAAAATQPVIDVRAEAEYAAGHVPGAQSLPLFGDAARARIGTLYKQVGREAAVLEGLRDVGPRLPDLVTAAQALAPDGQVLLYCWRGGMRSGSLAWLLETAGMQVGVLAGGYKHWRRHAYALFAQPWRLYVLCGYTGVGKTEVLRALAADGAQVLDLEALAAHRGSAFGGIGQGAQPSTEQFQNRMADVLQRFDRAAPVWVEDESATIGRCVLPEAFYRQMQAAPRVALTASEAYRTARLVAEYGAAAPEQLAAALAVIQRKLGGLAYRQAVAALQAGDLTTTAGIALAYYDRSYRSAQAAATRHLDVEQLGLAGTVAALRALR